MSTLNATNLINIFNGSRNFGTLAAAFFSDTYFGRYNILAVASNSSAVGILMLLLTAAIPELHPPFCEPDSSTCVLVLCFLLRWIPAFLMFLSCAFFFVGTKIYVMIMPQGSPLTKTAQVIVAAYKKRRIPQPDQPWEAAIITPEDHIKEDGSASNPWRLCTVQQVEEMKCVIRMIPIWISGVIYYIILNELHTYVVFQATQADRRIGTGNFKIPAASYEVFQMLSVTQSIPIYDKIIIPSFKRITKRNITILRRMGVGIVVGTATAIISGMVENWRRTVALTRPTVGVVLRKGEISSLNACWLIPQMALSGVSEAFAIISQIEFYYKEFPEDMRSFAGSFYFCGTAVASYLSSLIVAIVVRVTRNASGGGGNWLDEDLNKARLDYFYYLIAALEIINLVYFLICAKWYKYKGTHAKSDEDVTMDEITPVKHMI